MPKQAVLCIASTQAQALAIVNELKEQGFSNDDVSVLFPDKTGSKDFIHEKHTKAPEVAIQGVGAGGLLGALLGLLTGVGTLTIPGLGLLVAAGPLLAALSSAAVGAAIGGVAGSLIGLGIPEYEAKLYEGKISEGNILISVHVETPEQKKKVFSIFQSADAQDIAVSKEEPVDGSYVKTHPSESDPHSIGKADF